MNCPHDVCMTDFKKLRKIAWASEQGPQGWRPPPQYFCRSVYKKTKMKKKDVKFVFSCNDFFVKFTGVIFANRDNCPQGVKD